MNSGYLAFVQGERMVVLNQVGAWTLVFFKLLRIRKLEKEKQRDSHLTGHVKALGNKASFWNGYLGQSSQPVRDFVLVQVIPVKKNSGGNLLKKENKFSPETSRLGGELVTSLTVSCIEEKLCTACLVDQRTN